MKWIILITLHFLSVASAQNVTVTMGMPFQVKRVQAVREYQDFIISVMKDAGFNVVVEYVPGQLPYEVLVKGGLQAITYDDMSITHSRDKTVTVSFPIIKTRALFFYLASNTHFEERDLSKMKGAVSMANYVLDKEALRRKLNFIHTTSPLQSVSLLIKGKIDYFIAIEEVGMSAVESHPDAKGKVVKSKKEFLATPLYLTLHKSFKKDLPRIEAAFRKRLKGDLKAYPRISENLNKSP